MRDDSPEPSLDELDAKIRAAQAKRAEKKKRETGKAHQDSGLGFALRIATEMVAGIGVGVGIGLALDWWLDTGPWLLILFFFLGAGAGMMNMYRVVAGYGHAVGYKKTQDEAEAPDAKD